MTATLEPPQFRPRSALGWAEFLPRYLLVEAACRGRRVLEVGTQDPRSLVRLKEGGAAKVVGTAQDPQAVDPSGLLQPHGELVRMADGRLELDTDAFDVVLVVDLGRQVALVPGFLEEVRRVLAPDGFALLGFESGRGLSRLVDDRSPPPPLEPKRLQMAVKAVFPTARFYQQKPFIGVAIQPEGAEATGVSVAPSLAASHARPSHVIALAGAGAPEGLDPTLVALPFIDFEASAQAAQARSAADVERLLAALADARSQVEKRDASLRAIGERLPKLRRAFEQKLASMSHAEMVAPTVYERPADSEPPIPLAEPVEPLADQVAALREENATLQRRLRAREARDDQTEVIARDSTPAGAADPDLLRAEVTEIRAALEIAEEGRRTAESQEIEAHQRIRELERLVHERDAQLTALSEDVEAKRSGELALGVDLRDAQARAAQLARDLDEVQLAHAEQVRVLELRIAGLTDALGEAGGHEHQLSVDIQAVADARDESEAIRAELLAELGGERDLTNRLRLERDNLRVELQDRDRQLAHFEQRVADQAQALAAASGVQRAAAADRRAVGLAASHMAKEVETLRDRVVSLRKERDALAATSQMLLQERDEAAGGAIAGPVSTQALARLETELAAANARAEAHKEALSAESDRRQEAEAARETTARDHEQLQMVLHEVTMTAATTNQALLAAERRCKQLEATAADSFDQVGRALAAKAAAEARLLDIQRQAQTAQARAVDLQAEVATLGHRLAVRDRELSQSQARVRAMRDEVAPRTGPEQAERAAQLAALEQDVTIAKKDKAELEVALGRTLEEAAALSGRLQSSEQELGEARVALERSEGNRARFAAAVETLRAELEQATADRDAAFRAVETLRAETQRIERAWNRSAASAERYGDDDALRRQVQTLKADGLAARYEAREADLRAQQLAHRIRELQQQLHDAQASSVVALSVAPVEATVLKAKADEARDEILFLRTMLAERDAMLREARSEIAGLRELTVDASRSQDDARRAVDDQSSEVAALRARATQAQAEVGRLRAELADHQRAVIEQDEVQVRLTDQVERLQRAVMSLEGVAEARSSELAEARRSLEAAESALLTSHEASAASAADRDDTIARIRNLESALDVVRAERDRAETELSRRDDALASARTEVVELNDRLRALERAKSEVEEVTERLLATERERADLERRLAESTAAHTALSTANRAADDKATALTRQVSKAEALAAEARAQAVAVRTERDDLAEVIAGLRASLSDAKAELHLARRSSQSEARVPTGPSRGADLGRIVALEESLIRAEARASGAELAALANAGRPAADLAQAEERLAVAQAVAQGADQQLSEALSNLGRTRTALSEAEAHIDRLEDEAARLRGEVARMARRIGQLERGHQEAQVAQQAAQRESTATGQRIKEVERQLEARDDEADRSQRDLRDLQAKHDAVRQALEEARAAVEALRSEKDALETERDALVAEVGARGDPDDSSAQELAQTRAKLIELQAAHATLEQRAAHAEQQRTEAKRQVDTVADRLAGLQKAAFEREGDGDRLAALSTELDKVKQTRDALADVLDRASGAGEETEELAALRAKVAALDLKALQDDERVVAAEAEAEMLQARVSRLETQIGEAGDAPAVAKRLEEAEATVQSLQSRARALEASNDKAEARVRTLELQVAQRDVQLRAVASGDAESRLAELHGEADRARTALDEARADVGRKVNEVRGLQTELADARATLSVTESELAALKAQIEGEGGTAEVRDELAALKREVTRLQNLEESLASERHRLQVRLSDSEDHRVQSERRVTDLENQLADRDARVDRLNREIREKTERIRRLSGLSDS